MLLPQELDKIMSKLIKIEGPLDSHCWEWQGTLSKAGYGQIKISRIHPHMMQLHRLMFAHNHPDFKLFSDFMVCHHCDQRTCCNPAHLFQGTNQDNVNDRVSKGRSARNSGILNGRCKLTLEEVDQIVEMLPSLGNKEISKRLEGKASHAIVSGIRHGKLWSSHTKIKRGDYPVITRWSV